jgi:hypothetical protein
MGDEPTAPEGIRLAFSRGASLELDLIAPSRPDSPEPDSDDTFISFDDSRA